MRLIRRHLGVWAFAWLSCQVASLSALLPATCCVAHQELAEKSQDCHETVPGDDCPMVGANGQACPMHDGASHQNAEEQCAMRGTCGGPAAVLASLFSIPAVLLAESHVRIDAPASMLTAASDVFASTPASLDTPPPRS